MTGDGLNLPSIGRTEDGIQKVRDYQTLVRGSEGKGKFFCDSCGADITSVAQSVLNDSNDHVRPCPNSKCGKPLVFNAAWLAAKIIEARLRDNAGLGPACAEALEAVRPDGRKLIIARPGPASIRARVPEGGT